MPPIRLLELRNTYKWGGGPDKTILLSAERHDPKRVQVVVAYIRDVHDTEFQITRKAREKGLTYYEIPERWKFDPSVLWALRKIVIKYDINIIHAHDYKTDLFAYLLRQWLKKRRIILISTAHGWALMGGRGTLYRKMDHWLMNRFDHLIAVSASTKQGMVAEGIEESKVTVIHNGIDTESWARTPGMISVKQKLGLVNEFPIIGYVGRLTPEKDLETWIKAAALVAKRWNRARFVLVGEGRDDVLRKRLDTLAQTLAIDHAVMFLGYRVDLPAIYAMCDVFVLSSLTEGLPNCVLEAMAMEVPVITTDVPSATEFVIQNKTGLVVPRQNPQALARAQLDVLADDQRRQDMGRAARTDIEQRFDFMKRLRRVEGLYAQLLGLTSHGSTNWTGHLGMPCRPRSYPSPMEVKDRRVSVKSGQK